MGYSNFKRLKQVLQKFGLSDHRETLFENIRSITPSPRLQQALEIAQLMPLTNEKAKSEWVIAPILTEVFLAHQDHISLYSGEEMNIDTNNDLAGACDFILSLMPKTYELHTPIFALTEAKDEDLDYGIAQCTAQMYAAQLLNEQENQILPAIYGCATTAGEWRFLKLEDKKLIVDKNAYFLPELPKILGVFEKIIQEFTHATL
jgi:hypothetical protein